MTSPAPPDDDTRLWISDLADGRLDGPDLARACARWADDAAFRQTWLTYQLIGDAMRSEDLALPPARDERFLNGLRDRMAQEPIVLAPAEVQLSAGARRRAWGMPMALAASVVVVIGGLVLLRQTPSAEGPVLAERESGTAAIVANQQMLRDAQVDEYLRAHRETLAGSPVALPGGAMRSVDFNLQPR